MSGRRLFGIALGVATLVGLTSTVLLKVAIGLAGHSVSWPEAATGWIDWYLWALLTPLVVWLARELPITGRNWLRPVAAHVLIGGAVAAAELALFALVMTGYNAVFMQFDLPSYGARYLTLLGRWLPLGMLIYALIVAVVNAVDHGRRARERDVAAARLETELARTQVSALQAQIQPHFLFNTLNTIAMAVREGRNESAVTLIAQLSGILRRSIEAAVRPETSLKQELQFVREYLRLERSRMEDRLEVRWQVSDEVQDAKVPTMLLQPLVENAVRHGIADRAEGGTITIAAATRDGALVLRVEDSGCGMSADAEEGVGIENVRRRLEAHYGPDARLILSPGPESGTVARITLPYRTEGTDEPDRFTGSHPGAHR
jgi:signal transduction histidine kinase